MGEKKAKTAHAENKEVVYSAYTFVCPRCNTTLLVLRLLGCFTGGTMPCTGCDIETKFQPLGSTGKPEPYAEQALTEPLSTNEIEAIASRLKVAATYSGEAFPLLRQLAVDVQRLLARTPESKE